MARDFTHLDHDALVSLGITATGHRKRILRLVSHIQRTQDQQANQEADPPRDRCQAVTVQGHTSASDPVGSEVFRNISTPSLSAMHTDSGSDIATVKPVPKPRTVFNRRRTAPVHFCLAQDPVTLPPRRLSQESICFTLLEGLTEDMPTSDNTSDLTDNLTMPRRLSQAERRRPSRSLSLSDTGRSLPPVPPRMNHGVSPALYEGLSSSSPVLTEQKHKLPLTSCPGGLENSRLSGSSPSGSPRESRMEMVSNEIYWGTLPGPTVCGGAKVYCSQQSAPPTPPRQASDRTPERNR